MVHTWSRIFIDLAGNVPPMLAALALVGGVIILLLGWRLSRLVAVLDFSIFGIVVGAVLTGDAQMQWLSAAVGAAAFGVLALWLDRYGEVVAGGLLAGLLAALLMGWFGAPPLATLLAVAGAFGCAVAVSLIVMREASAVMTAVQGGLLAAFGIASCLAHNDAVWWQFRELLVGSTLALAMFLAAPVGVGLTFQLAAIQTDEVAGR